MVCFQDGCQMDRLPCKDLIKSAKLLQQKEVLPSRGNRLTWQPLIDGMIQARAESNG